MVQLYFCINAFVHGFLSNFSLDINIEDEWFGIVNFRQSTILF